MGRILIWGHFFSSDYGYFLPAILVCTTWMLLPIPEAAKVCLLLCSLPLFTAEAARALNQGQDTLVQMNHRRCPMQGVIVFFFTLFPNLFTIRWFFIMIHAAHGTGDMRRVPTNDRHNMSIMFIR
jgi:hypothetical protein